MFVGLNFFSAAFELHYPFQFAGSLSYLDSGTLYNKNNIKTTTPRAPFAMRLPRELIWLLVLCLCGEDRLSKAHSSEPDEAAPVVIRVDCSHVVGPPVRPVWASTGFAPPQNDTSWLLSEAVRLNLALIGSLPVNAIRQVRIHWLLDLVASEADVRRYDSLDRLLHQLWVHDLKPGFELMGNPGGAFSDLTQPEQVSAWRSEVSSLARHLVRRYGLKEVSSWNFESWNEPDHHDFAKLNFTLQAYLNYYDACSEGLKDVHQDLKLGGPGGSCRHPRFVQYCHGLLEHCQSGRNFFSGEAGVRLDFVSVHKKGHADVDSVVDQMEDTFAELGEKFPFIVRDGLPLFNDEADPLVSWWRAEAWRGDAAYPALAARLVVATRKRLVRQLGLDVAIVSNDNAFVNTPPTHFDQRTLLNRFSRGEESQFVGKPIFNLMSLLALLGEGQLHDDSEDVSEEAVSKLSVLATRSMSDSGPLSFSVLLVNADNSTQKAVVKLSLLHLLSSLGHEVDSAAMEAKFATYKVSNTDTNPREAWRRQGEPQFPTSAQMGELRRAAALKRSPVRDLDRTHFSVKLPAPSVKLLHVCFKSQPLPMQPTRLAFYRESSSSLIVTWRYAAEAKCLKGFVVETAHSIAGPFIALNEGHESIVNFAFVPFENGTAASWFRVKAVDFWDRESPYSVPTLVGSNIK